jgi:anti-sigma factor RsiW
MACREALRVQAYFDGELDAGAAVEIEHHVESCAECEALLQELRTGRGALHQQGLYHRAGPALASRIASALDRESGRRRWLDAISVWSKDFWAGAGAGGLVTAAAAAVALTLVATPPSMPLANDLISAHLRSLMSGHLIDVVSSDQHTVKPWFAGRADVSPTAVDFPDEDYRLAGGRVDYVDGKRTAVVVYRHGAHVINVFAWAKTNESVPETLTRNGYHLVFWQSGDLILCAVSDTGLDEILRLKQLVEEKSDSTIRE